MFQLLKLSMITCEKTPQIFLGCLSVDWPDSQPQFPCLKVIYRMLIEAKESRVLIKCL